MGEPFFLVGSKKLIAKHKNMGILPLFSQLISDCWPLQCIVHTQRIARQICLYSISPIFHNVTSLAAIHFILNGKFMNWCSRLPSSLVSWVSTNRLKSGHSDLPFLYFWDSLEEAKFYFVFFNLPQLWPTQLPKLANLTAPLQIWFVPTPEMQLFTIRRWGRNDK